MNTQWAQRVGLWRSLAIYYGPLPLRYRRMRQFYAQFIRPNDLCFDIGAHVGNRVLLWSALGARVVALEPQAACVRFLRRWYDSRPNVTVLPLAAGAGSGTVRLRVSSRNPTVSTLSEAWIEAVQQDDAFADVAWDAAETVTVTTLDALIDRFGIPEFVKIDVEGYELPVLRGLSHAPAALSFEYVATGNAEAVACVERLCDLGSYRFNWSRGESHRWASAEWLSPTAMITHLNRLVPGDGSGDVYARLAD